MTNLGIGATMPEMAGDSPTTEDKIHKPSREKNVSGELDVFQATRYFSGFNEPTTTEYSRIQIEKQSIATEHRQNRVHPETGNQRPEPRVVVVKSQETRHGGGKLASFFSSLLRSVSLKKSKSKSTLQVVETPRGERKRRQSCVVTAHAEAASPISGAGAWHLNTRRRSFDDKHVKASKKSDQNLNLRFCEDLNAGDDVDVNGGCESDSSSESDLFELDLFAKSKYP